MGNDIFLIGIDGGGTGTRAVLADARGRELAQGSAGPSGLALGIEAAWRSIEAA
ncbi:ATPase, partial [Burkholderia pseudomallei]|nr:ATPase [Burkholderia pseudomallei]